MAGHLCTFLSLSCCCCVLLLLFAESRARALPAPPIVKAPSTPLRRLGARLSSSTLEETILDERALPFGDSSGEQHHHDDTDNEAGHFEFESRVLSVEEEEGSGEGAEERRVLYDAEETEDFDDLEDDDEEESSEGGEERRVLYDAEETEDFDDLEDDDEEESSEAGEERRVLYDAEDTEEFGEEVDFKEEDEEEALFGGERLRALVPMVGRRRRGLAEVSEVVESSLASSLDEELQAFVEGGDEDEDEDGETAEDAIERGDHHIVLMGHSEVERGEGHHDGAARVIGTRDSLRRLQRQRDYVEQADDDDDDDDDQTLDSTIGREGESLEVTHEGEEESEEGQQRQKRSCLQQQQQEQQRSTSSDPLISATELDLTTLSACSALSSEIPADKVLQIMTRKVMSQHYQDFVSQLAPRLGLAEESTDFGRLVRDLGLFHKLTARASAGMSMADFVKEALECKEGCSLSQSERANLKNFLIYTQLALKSMHRVSGGKRPFEDWDLSQIESRIESSGALQYVDKLLSYPSFVSLLKGFLTTPSCDLSKDMAFKVVDSAEYIVFVSYVIEKFDLQRVPGLEELLMTDFETRDALRTLLKVPQFRSIALELLMSQNDAQKTAEITDRIMSLRETTTFVEVLMNKLAGGASLPEMSVGGTS